MNENQRIVLRSLKNDLETLRDEEQDKYDNAPENLQDTERVEKFQENAEKIQEAIDILEELED